MWRLWSWVDWLSSSSWLSFVWLLKSKTFGEVFIDFFVFSHPFWEVQNFLLDKCIVSKIFATVLCYWPDKLFLSFSSCWRTESTTDRGDLNAVSFFKCLCFSKVTWSQMSVNEHVFSSHTLRQWVTKILSFTERGLRWPELCGSDFSSKNKK